MKLKYALLILMAVVASAGVLSISEPLLNEKKYEAVSSNAVNGFVYTVKEYGGMVAVFDYGSDRPLEILNCPVNSLPEDEIKQLANGIDVETDEQLQNLIEAYD